MITKERLEELIKKGATIVRYFFDEWDDCWAEENIHLDNKNNKVVEDGNYCYLYRNEYPHNVGSIDELYETQKQLDWALKYRATRTEELNLPMWEEFKDYNKNESVAFVGEDWKVYELSNDIDIYHKPRILLTADGEYFEEWKSTEENYIKACDLCLKLFNGEEE